MPVIGLWPFSLMLVGADSSWPAAVVAAAGGTGIGTVVTAFVSARRLRVESRSAAAGEMEAAVRVVGQALAIKQSEADAQRAETDRWRRRAEKCEARLDAIVRRRPDDGL